MTDALYKSKPLRCSADGSLGPQVLTKALQLHPNAGGLWSYAAAWEFELNANAAAARTLMQRGLRMCKREPSLWLEYFRLELMYVHKLLARRRVLGLDGESPAAGALRVYGQWLKCADV